MLRKRAGVILAAFALLLAGVAGPASAAGKVTAAFGQPSVWDTGYGGQYTVANGTAASISSWTVVFTLPAGSTVGSSWDATVTNAGSTYTAVNKGWNGTVAPGASVTFGFNVAGTGKPLSCTVNGASCDGTGGDTTAPSAPAGLRSTGASSSTVSLAWTAATDNVGVTGYDIAVNGANRLTVTGVTATVGGLAGNTAYTFTVKAHDAAGNVSAASNQLSASTSNGGPAPAGLPFAPYVDLGSWPTPVLSTEATAANTRNFTLAFVIAAGCRASWFNAYDPRTGWQRDEIDKLRASGGDVKISFGGASGQELAQACTDVTALTAEYQAVVNAYALTYIDFDIEGTAVAEPASIARRSQAMARLQAANPGLRISLTLPVLPEGLDQNGFKVLQSAKAAGVNLDLVNVMAMDYNRSTGDYGNFAVQAAQSTFAQVKSVYGKSDADTWRMVGVTPMLGKNDDGGTYDQADGRQLVAFAQANHLGMLSFWELTRDRNACTGALYKCTNVPQTPYEFSRIFAGYTG